MKKIFLSLAAILTIASLPASAQLALPTAYEPEWTVEECMRYAVEHSPSVVRQKLTNSNLRANYTESILNHLPTLNSSPSGSFNYGRNVDPETNTYATRSTFSSGYSISTGLTIFNGLNLINNTRINKVAKLKGDEELKQAEDKVALDAMQAFYNVSYQMGSVTLAREQAEEGRRTLEQSRRMLALGLKSAADIAQIEADVAAYEYALTKAENDLQVYELTLKQKMNFPLDEPLLVDTAARYAVPALETMPAEDVARIALGILPDAKLTQFDIRTRQLQLSTYKARLFPSLSASGSIGSSYYTSLNGDSKTLPFNTQYNNNLSKGFGFSMGIPIFNGLTRQLDIKRGRNNLRITEQTHIETIRQLTVEVEQAVLELNGAYMEREQAARQVRFREISYRVAQQKYNEGLLSALDLQTIANQLLSARSSFLNADLTWQAKRKIVDYYQGIPLLND